MITPLRVFTYFPSAANVCYVESNTGFCHCAIIRDFRYLIFLGLLVCSMFTHHLINVSHEGGSWKRFKWNPSQGQHGLHSKGPNLVKELWFEDRYVSACKGNKELQSSLLNPVSAMSMKAYCETVYVELLDWFMHSQTKLLTYSSRLHPSVNSPSTLNNHPWLFLLSSHSL